MSYQPKAYARLMEAACDQPRQMLRAHFEKAAVDHTRTLAELLDRAYVEGVRDGFAQGIAAAEEQSDG